MIDCSLSAFVLGNCFVLLTVCLRSRPDSRDIAAPFFAYLQNMFKTVSKWITVEYVKVGEGWGGTLELFRMFRASRCVTGFRENKMHALQMEVRLYLSVCCLWGLTSFRVDEDKSFGKKGQFKKRGVSLRTPQSPARNNSHSGSWDVSEND